MIKRINKISNLGIFAEHTKSPEFKRFTLFYGWNGSGKTTLSRLFSVLNTGVHIKYPDLKYEIETNLGKISQSKSYAGKIIVFNKEYIEENAPSLENPALPSKHIFVLGKEDKTFAKRVENNKKLLQSAVDALTKDDPQQGVISLIKQLENKKSGYEDLFTKSARIIAALRGGSAIRQYQKPEAIEAYKNLKQKSLLSVKEIENSEAMLRQEKEQEITKIDIDKIHLETKKNEELIRRIELCLSETIQRQTIKRLDENSDIADWVAKGLEVHRTHESKKCEYCQREILLDRVNQLADHFNDAHNKLINEIDTVTTDLRSFWSTFYNINVVDKATLYKDLRKNYDKKKIEFEQIKKALLDEVQNVGELLKSKKLHTNKAVSLNAKLEFKKFKNLLVDLNVIIEIHNKRTKEFISSQNQEFERLEKHYISTIYDDAKILEKNIVNLQLEIKNKQEISNELQKQINTDESSLRNSKGGCDSLNKILIDIIGRDELSFEDEDTGYVIKRNGKIANDLSDGEKSTIAFAYFITHLTGKDFDLKDGIVVIDDPISSLDLDAIYRIVGLIKSNLKKANQLILMTHNYDFFNQIKRWFIYDPDIAYISKDARKPVNGEVLMIKNIFSKTLGIRVAKITEIDNLLRDYESEYHYLFKKLIDFEDDLTEEADGTIAAVYDYPNIARKVLECFLSFRVPEPLHFYARIKKLKHFNKSKIKDEELENIYNFVNSNSHLDTKTGLIQFDPTIAKNGKKYIQMTLELIKNSDGEHYKSMAEQLK